MSSTHDLTTTTCTGRITRIDHDYLQIGYRDMDGGLKGMYGFNVNEAMHTHISEHFAVRQAVTLHFDLDSMLVTAIRRVEP